MTIDSPIPDIPGHELLTPLGRGGMGEVWRTMETGTGRMVALKLLIRAPAGSSAPVAARLARFEQEMEFAARLEHPGIAQFHTHGVAADGTPFFTMELIEGEPLESYAATHSRTPREVLQLFLPVCEAVAHAHQRGVIHRDLKPANLLVTAAGQPKVLDFGLAKTMDRSLAVPLSGDGDILGTPLYMSPEQAAGDSRKVGTPADVWALGVILYRLLTGGTHPFPPEGTTGETLARILAPGSIRPLRSLLPALDRDLCAIAGKCLAHSPAHRYAGADALAADLRAWLAGHAVTARTPGFVERSWRCIRRHRYAAASAAAVLITAAGFSAWYLAERKRSAAAREATLLRARELVSQLMAEVHHRLRDTGHGEVASEAMQRAASFEWNLEDVSGEFDSRRFQSLSTILQARALTNRGEFLQALQLWREAAATLDALRSEHPESTAFRRDTAAARLGEARALLCSEATEPAITALRQSCDLYRADMDGKDAHQAIPALETSLMLARLLLDQRQPAEVSALLAPALTLTASRAAQPDAPLFWHCLHASTVACAERARLFTDPAPAEAAVRLRAAAAALEQRARGHTDPALPVARGDLGIATGDALRRTGDLPAAHDTIAGADAQCPLQPGLPFDSPSAAARIGLGLAMLSVAEDFHNSRLWSQGRLSARHAAGIFDLQTGSDFTRHPGSHVVLLYRYRAYHVAAACARQLASAVDETDDLSLGHRFLRQYHERHQETADYKLHLAQCSLRLYELLAPADRTRALTWLDKTTAHLAELDRLPVLTSPEAEWKARLYKSLLPARGL